MKHIDPAALGAGIIRKGEEDDPASIVTKALEDLTKSLDDRLKDVVTKGDLAGLETRVKAVETKANRPGDGGEKKEDAVAERKAFGLYLRSTPQNPVPADELKALTVSNDAQGG